MAQILVELRGRITFISITEEDEPLDGAKVSLTRTKMEIGLTVQEVHKFVGALAQIQMAISTMDKNHAIKSGHLRLVDAEGAAPKES